MDPMAGPGAVDSRALPLTLVNGASPGVASPPIQARPVIAVEPHAPSDLRSPAERDSRMATIPAPLASAAVATAKPSFSPSVLAAALAADPLGPGHQAAVRDQLRLLIGKYGAVDRDVAQKLSRAADYKVERLLPFNGAHLANGLIQMSPKSHAEAVRFLNGARDRSAIKGMSSLVHEGLHGHSPVGAERWGSVNEAGQRIDHLAVAAAAQAVMVREFHVKPESIITDVPYGVNETIDVIASNTGVSRVAARNALYDSALHYLGAGPELGTGQAIEQRFVDATSAVTGKKFDEALRRQLQALPG